MVPVVELDKAKRILGLLIIIILFSFTNVHASSINKLDVDIDLKEDGTAHITETWNVTTYKETELYKSVQNIGDKKAENFIVSEKRKKYSIMDWDSNLPRKDKKYKYGIKQKVGNDVDLYWGLRNGSHTYILEYDIIPFITNYKDKDATLYNVISKNMNILPKNVNITITLPQNFDEYTSNIDITGMEYIKSVENNIITFNSVKKYHDFNYSTLLFVFPPNTFNSTEKKGTYHYELSSNFNDLKEKYQTTHEVYTFITHEKRKSRRNLIIVIVFVILFAFALAQNKKTKKTKVPRFYNTIFIDDSIKEEIKKSTDYYRDLPCDGDLFKMYFVAYIYDFLDNKVNILGAILLRWINKDYISLEKDKDGNSYLKLKYEGKFNNKIERELYQKLLALNIEGKTITSDKLTMALTEGRINVDKLLSSILSEGKNYYLNKKYFTKKPNSNILYPTKELEQEAINIQNFKNFLKDFTIINQREVLEIKVFEKYLEYAQTLGVSTETIDTFKDVYPSFIKTFEGFVTSDYMDTFLETANIAFLALSGSDLGDLNVGVSLLTRFVFGSRIDAFRILFGRKK